MKRIKFTFGVFILGISLTGYSQSIKKGSIFTETTKTRIQIPGLEAVKNIPPNAAVLRDILYCKVGSKELRMDAYLPKNRSTVLPQALIYIHGGAWISGDKDEGPFEQDLADLISRNYAVFPINYRLGPFSQFPSMIEDCKCAVRSLRANAKNYNVDATRIGVWGSSAGGHLAGLLGTTAGISQLEGYGGYPEESSVVQAVATYFGPSDLTTSDWGFLDKIGFLTVFGTSKNWAKASPITYVNKGDTPFLVIGGDRDHLVDIRQQQLMHAKLQAAGVPSELLIVKNCEHEFEPKGGALNPSRTEVTKRLGDFFDKYLRSTSSTLTSVQASRSMGSRRIVETRYSMQQNNELSVK